MIAIFPLALAIWFCFDNSWPFWDGASHVLDSWRYKELFAHPSVFKISWWHQLLTVNYCYPPQMHMFIGALMLLFQNILLSVNIAQVLFCALMSASVYILSLDLLGSKRAASISVVLLNCFPLVINHSHQAYLDFASLALFLFAMCSLVFWDKNKNWRNAIFLGVVLGFAVSSKQLASCFLFFPCLMVLLNSIRQKKWIETAQIAVAGCIASGFLLVWLVPNIQSIREFTQRPCSFADNPTLMEVVSSNAIGYYSQVSQVVSPILYVALGISLLATPLSVWRKLWIVVTSFVGVVFFLTISYNGPEYRYIFPTLVLFAMLVGSFADRLISKRNFLLKFTGILLPVVAILQYLTYSFTPYPVGRPEFVAQIPLVLGVKENTGPTYCPDKHPTQPGDIWKQDWVVETIKNHEKNQPVYLYIAPNEPRYNVHTFNLIAKLKDSNLNATTSRLWTLSGDDIRFDREQLKHYQWFLLKRQSAADLMRKRTGQEVPRDKSSEIAMINIENSIQQETSLIGSVKVPDGSTLELYRRN